MCISIKNIVNLTQDFNNLLFLLNLLRIILSVQKFFIIWK